MVVDRNESPTETRLYACHISSGSSAIRVTLLETRVNGKIVSRMYVMTQTHACTRTEELRSTSRLHYGSRKRYTQVVLIQYITQNTLMKYRTL